MPQDAEKNPAMFLKASKSSSADDARDDKRDQRRQKTGSGKSGGGTQGRETKTKKTKNKYKGRGGHDDAASDDESASATSGGGGRQDEVEFLSVDEIAAHLKRFEALADCDEAFVEEIATQLYRYVCLFSLQIRNDC